MCWTHITIVLTILIRIVIPVISAKFPPFKRTHSLNLTNFEDSLPDPVLQGLQFHGCNRLESNVKRIVCTNDSRYVE